MNKIPPFFINKELITNPIIIKYQPIGGREYEGNHPH